MALASIRQHTSHLHHRVEAAVDIVRRVETAEGYRDLLTRLYGFYLPLEARLDRVAGLGEIGLDLAARTKAPLLAADLAHLGLTPHAIDSLPRCQLLPGPRSVAEALGCLYVIEGSTLGGQVIRRHVERSLGLSGNGCRFFCSYGENVGRMWKAYCGVLEAVVVAPADEERAVAAAVETFNSFEAWVAGLRHPLGKEVAG